MMDWTLIGIILAVGFFVATIVLAFKLARKKKPVWARNTRRIIGIGTDAPPELKMTFHGRPVDDVYKTVFIFFNRGTESIRNTDVAEAVAIHFEGANILRQPTILAARKEANKLSVRHLVKDGDEAIEIDFLYLDRGDGAVVEVFHTKSKRIRCSGIIMGANEIAYIGEFLPYRPPRWLTIIYGVMFVVTGGVFYVLFRNLSSEFVAAQDKYLLAVALTFVLFLIVNWVRVIVVDFPVFYRYLKFPKWTGFLKLPLSDETKLR